MLLTGPSDIFAEAIEGTPEEILEIIKEATNLSAFKLNDDYEFRISILRNGAGIHKGAGLKTP